MSDDPGGETATGIADAVRQGTRSATDVIAESLRRIEADETNSFISVDENAATQAEQIDAMVAKGTDPGPLAGVPIAIKDLIDHEGRVTTAGSEFYRHRAETTAPVVRLLEDAGAVVVGRANLHEFAFGFDSENPWFGPVRNPWDLNTSTGGSSGGSAAAVASGVVPLSLGTDTGGSVRVPAAMTGVFGLKVTHGAVSIRAVFPLVPSCDTVGPFATTIDDLALAYSVMAVPDPDDPFSRQAEGNPRPIRRLGVPHPWVDKAPTSATVAADFARALSDLEESGVEIVDVTIPQLEHPGLIMDAIGLEVAQVHRGYFQADEPYGESVAPRVAAALEVNEAADQKGRHWRAETREATKHVLSDVDGLITPTVANTRKVIGDHHIEGRGARAVLSYFSALVNHVGLPAISMPLQISAARPPTSIQVIGDDWSEGELLALGRRLERQSIVGFRTPRVLPPRIGGSGSAAGGRAGRLGTAEGADEGGNSST